MKTFEIIVINPKAKLCKIISPLGYTKKDLADTFAFYGKAGYDIMIRPFLKD